MKFIDDICDGIVSPPKLRYSPYDLGRHPLIKVALYPPLAGVTIFRFSIHEDSVYRPVSTNMLEDSALVWSTYTA
jgi:hypothetical protein